MIEVAGLSKEYVVDAGPVVALQNVNLMVGAGERLGLFGPSGSGKTTLLRCIAGLEEPDEGVIRIGNDEVFNATDAVNWPPWRRPIGFVFQDHALWPHLRVVENVMFPLQYGRANVLTRSQQRAQALDVLHRVRLDGFGERYPSELSGGQRQRVAIARALVSRPSVLLMDEPLSSLDPHLRKQTRGELVEILEEAAITTIFVTHDHVEGLFMTDLVGIMRNGRLVQAGTALDVFQHPADASVAEALDIGAVFKCERLTVDDDHVRLRILETQQWLQFPRAAAGSAGDERYLMVIPGNACSLTPESVDGDNLQQLTGQVIGEHYAGRGWCVLASVAGVTLELWDRLQAGVRHGDMIEIVVNVERVRIFKAG